MSRAACKLRLWPLYLIGIGAVVTIVFIKLTSGEDRQSGNINATIAGLIACLLAFAWLTLWSRLPLRVRVRAALAICLAAVFAGTVLYSFLEVHGVDGDLVPIIRLRRDEVSLEAVQGAVALPEVLPAELEGLADSAQFFGPGRDGKLSGPRLARDWQAQAPEILWRRDVGAGWSGFSVAGRRAITQEQHGDEEATVCYDIMTGTVLWLRKDAGRYDNPVAGLGPRATPTIEADRVYVQGATGLLHCLELATGKSIWSVNIITDNAAALPEWGVSGSPLIVDDKVVVSAGGHNNRSLVAYDKLDGHFVWGGGTQPAQWSSPFRCSLAGKDQILIFNSTEMTAHSVETGEVLWSYPWRGAHPHVCLPVVLEGDRVMISSGYGTGCHLVEITKDAGGAFSAVRIWRSRSMKAKFTNVIDIDGYVYGIDDGILACVDLAKGRRKWKSGRYGHGQMLLVGEVLLIQAESGEVILVDPSPEAAKELTRFEVLTDKTWNPPTLAGRFLLVRNDREAVCLRLPVADE